MNNTAKVQKMQQETEKSEKMSRAEYRRKTHADEKEKKKAAKASDQDDVKKKKAARDKTQVIEGLAEKAEEIMKNLKAHTWKDLEANGKFDHDKKLSFISDDMLIVGCDIGSETHYFRAIDSKGIELSRKPMAFRNTREGFEGAKRWAVDLAARNEKTQIVLGLEPTGHYWFVIASWMICNGISVVQVNPYAVKCTKEVGDNSQDKNDRKDPKVIAELVKNGNYGMPYLPEGAHAEIRSLNSFRDQLVGDRVQRINRLHREITEHFPEFKEVFSKIESIFSLRLLEQAQAPEDMQKLGAEGIRNIWKTLRLKGVGYKKAQAILNAAMDSVGLKEGLSGARMAISWYASDILRISEELDKVESCLQERCTEIANSGNILAIRGIGNDILAGILSELGDINRFDDVKEIQKLSGLGLVASSSGKHDGKVKISKRGRKRLRYWLYQGARSVVAHAEEFKAIHEYYTTRKENPLKKQQSLIAVACKLLRVIYTLLKTGAKYDPEKLLRDIIRPENTKEKAAA